MQNDAYAEEKTKAVSEILRVEYDVLGPKLRCVIVTDFEKTSSTALVEGIHDREAGGAIGVFKALVHCELGDQLDPILMTGSTLLVDDDIAAKFLEKARAWVLERDLKIEFEDIQMDRFHHIHGSGADWAPRYYSTMVTEFFQEGFTKCLIGTRGLLGEGWDASRINVLVDLTTVTTSMSINQLRGRSMRLDKLWKEKVANNWDVICLAEEFIKGFDDYDRFREKHTNLFGVCDDGSIEKGVGHVHAAFTELQPEGINEGMNLINQEMLERARQRSNSRQRWAIGQPFSSTARKSLEFLPPTTGSGGLGFQFGNRTPWAQESRHRGASHIMLHRVFLHARYRQRARWLGNRASILKNVFHRGTDFIGADGNHVINALANQPKGLLAHLRHSAAIGKKAHLAQRDATAFFQGSLNTGSVLRLHADNSGVWPDISQIGSHAGQQSATAATDKHIVQRLLGLSYQLNCHCALTGNHVGVIKGVNKGEAFRFC